MRFATVLAIVAIALGGCARRGGKIPYDPVGFGPPDPSALSEPAYDIPVGPLDVLRITVFRVTDLTGEFQVDSRGLVNLPLIGAIDARGQRPEQLADSLERLYSQRYLNNPDITVRVLSTNQANITVDGGVNAPGIYALPGKTTLLGAIAIARGVNADNGNPKRVAIFRKRDGKTVAAAFDLVSIRHGEMVDPLVYPGDTIVVDGAQLRAIYRELLQTLPLFAIFGQL
ncbi:MAG TPA: polysaccharide biosynthesis/export family protein [Novosphingobium sp.]|nr:polysaccharide biosynthesis/export family protein [Novosphingobium sp.]